MLSAHELNVFIEAALAQNFSVAARRLGLSQPAVSLHISNLERHLELELFRRNGRSIQLSEAGCVLLPLAQEAVRQMKQIEETMCGLKGVMIGELSVACSTAVGKYILPRLVAGFRRLHPDVRVAVNMMPRRTALEWVLGGRADIAVVSARLNHGAELEYEPFVDDQVVLIVPPDHAWADGRTVTPEDLLTVPFILREPAAGTYEVLAEGLNRNGLDISQLKVALTLTSGDAVEMSVEAGIGAAFVSRLEAHRGLAAGKVVEARVQGMALSRTIYLVRSARRAGTPLQEAFWQFAFVEENSALRSLQEG
jgi:DNA-binding transcriptional LysR family regulator